MPAREPLAPQILRVLKNQELTTKQISIRLGCTTEAVTHVIRGSDQIELASGGTSRTDPSVWRLKHVNP